MKSTHLPNREGGVPSALGVSGRTAPARPPAAASFWKIWIPIPICLLLLDATFNLYFWKIPKVSGPRADHAYQFLIDAHRLSSEPKPPGAARVVAFGSSVVRSFGAEQVEHLLEADASSPPVEVHRMLTAGIKPSDYRVFFESERDAIQPDVVVILLNLVDFLNPSFERDLKPQVRAVLPPWTALKERHAQMATVSDQLDLVLSGVSNLYRYRRLIRWSVRDHAQFAMRWLHGPSAQGGYGWYPDGYTARRFGLPTDGRSALEVRYFVHSAWIQQRAKVALQFSVGARALATRVETEPGWKTVHLSLPSSHDAVLDVTADSVWSPRAAGISDDIRLLGVRLSSPPSSAANGRRPPLRYPPADGELDRPVLRGGGAVGDAFVAYFETMLQGDTPFARRYQAYRQAKLAVRHRTFQPSGEYAGLAGLVKDFTDHGVSVVLVNNPENPLILREYEDTPYYRSHVAFLAGLAQRNPNVWFADLCRALPPEDFNDWHHVNFVGQIKLGPIYTQLVRQALAARASQRRLGS